MTFKRLISGTVTALVFSVVAAAPVAAQKAPAKKTAKTTSPCKGLSESSCKGNKVCGWIVPKKKVDKRGRKLKPYCRKVAGIAKKKKTAATPKKK
jgi:hypothetical protein